MRNFIDWWQRNDVGSWLAIVVGTLVFLYGAAGHPGLAGPR